MRSSQILGSVAAITAVAHGQTKISGVSIPPELTYLLGEGYMGNINANFIDTKTNSSSTNAILAAARNATYYSYDPEFHSIVGSSPTARVISGNSSGFSHEAGVWASDRNEVWFTAGSPPQRYNILDLSTYTVKSPNNSPVARGAANLGGGDYFNGTVYFAALGSKANSLVPAVYSVDPATEAVTTVLDSWYGVPLNSIDDISWVAPNTSTGATSCTHPGEANLFFSSLDLEAIGEFGFSTPVLPNAIWRFTPSTNTLKAVVPRSDVIAPNGIRTDPSGRYLYATDVAYTALSGVGSNSSGSSAIYRWDLDRDCNPVNKVMLAMVRSTLADGLHVDDFGRVWTAEYNGIVVRNYRGKELGVFNAEQLVDKASFPIGNFALAGDKLVVLGGDRITVIQLAQNVTTPAGTHSKR